MTTAEQLDRYFLARALRWRGTLETFDAEQVAQIIKVMRSLKRDLYNQLMSNADSLAIPDADRLRRLDLWLDDVLAGASATITGTITEASILAATASVAEYNAIMSLGGKAPLARTVGFTPEQLTTWFANTEIFENMKLTTRVDNAMSAGVKQNVLDELRKLGIEGKGTADSVKSVMQTALNQGFVLTERESVTLTRSYIQAANVGAMDSVMQANKKLLRGWRWCAKLDLNTCHLCSANDGIFYTLEQQSPPMPRHWRCRCVKQWVTNNPRDFGLPDDEIQRLTRTWVEREKGAIGAGGGRKILNAGKTTEFYGGWFKTLTDAQQNDIIGVRRATLLREGKISWGELIDKRTGEYRTLEDLGFSLSGKRI